MQIGWLDLAATAGPAIHEYHAIRDCLVLVGIRPDVSGVSNSPYVFLIGPLLRNLSSSGALAGRDETAWGVDQSVSLVRELLGGSRAACCRTPSSSHGRGRNKRGRNQVSNYETVEPE